MIFGTPIAQLASNLINFPREAQMRCGQLLKDAEGLRCWADAARPGESTTYFRGHLAMAADISPAARELAELVTWLYAEGLVTPVQQRLGKHDYRYVLQRTQRLAA